MSEASIAQNGRRSSIICSKSSMLNTFLWRANLYHSANAGGGCLPYLLLYFSTVRLNVVEIPLSYDRHCASASSISCATGWRSKRSTGDGGGDEGSSGMASCS